MKEHHAAHEIKVMDGEILKKKMFEELPKKLLKTSPQEAVSEIPTRSLKPTDV